MNLETINKWLDDKYGVSYTRLEELHDFVVEQDLKHQEKAQKEIDRLNNVINELEKWLINETEKLHNISGDNFTTVGQSVYQEILDKLKELKEGK